MKRKAIAVEEVVALVPDGARLMIGGSMGVSSPHRLTRLPAVIRHCLPCRRAVRSGSSRCINDLGAQEWPAPCALFGGR
jgi:hypothetical protein